MVVPVIATEGPARKLVLEYVVHADPARTELPPAVAEDVPGCTHARSNLVAPPERDGVGDLDAVHLRPERGQELVLDPHAQIDGETGVHLPGILGVNSVVAAGHCGIQPDAVLPRVVAVRTPGAHNRPTRVTL